MKRIIGFVLLILLIAGCVNNSAKGAVDSYLKKYKNLDNDVLIDMEDLVERENLNNKQKDVYRDILKKQYKDLEYVIESEEVNGDDITVTVKISVYDLYKVQSDSIKYLDEHKEEFNDENGIYDQEKYIDYKLDKMKNTNNKIEYTIKFKVKKEDNKYIIEQPSDTDLLKIHGIYNYELD